MKPRKRKKRMDPNTLLLIKQIVFGILILFLLGGVVTGVWYGSRIDALTIQNVVVEEGKTIPIETVESLVDEALLGEYVGLIPKTFSYLYPDDYIEEKIRSLDRIKEVEVERTDLRSLRVTFEEYLPDTLWCENDEGDCVFIDETGYAFAEAPQLSGGSFLRLDKIGVTPVENVQAFGTDVYNRVKELVDVLENNSWFIEAVEVDAANDAYLQLSRGGELKVALDDDPETIVENLFTVINSPDFINLNPGNFEYIDLRFGNKVFVNENGAEPDEVLASSTESELE